MSSYTMIAHIRYRPKWLLLKNGQWELVGFETEFLRFVPET